MKKLLISSECYDDSENEGYYMVDPDDIESCTYWDGSEGLYRYNERDDDMDHVAEEYTKPGDGDRYFLKIIDGEPHGYMNLSEEDFAKAEKVKITYWEGCEEEYSEEFVEVTDFVCHSDYQKVTLPHGINSTDVVISDPDGLSNPTMMEVDVELVDTIPMDYPNQQFVGIYEGTDEDGKRIRIDEFHPFCEDDNYPLCNITYLD